MLYAIMVLMIAKQQEKEKAILLRKQGKTYSEILKEIHVAKSSLSLWFREVKLSKPQVQKITLKRKNAQIKGAQAKRSQRISRENIIIAEASNQIGILTNFEFMLVGIALYWAEGSKAKPHNISQGVDFGNSDANMISIYMEWLRKSLKVSNERITISLYIHENSKYKINEVIQHWLKITKLPKTQFQNVFYKKHNPVTKRKVIQDSYFGLLRVKVKRSTDLNRKIQGWILGITRNCGSLS
ncbi:MAG: hypothetical protein UV60_C0005G0012 [Parcubacteria group bacterium GW2011_GWA2_43_11]|nr:MAG: hypothetical protein UU89_C0004G0011 [Parcubacteria group bacterium GW2011_GWC2_42_11]KKS85822.1 MAG: hypothetical protein UV60_C0005G0012 [Parcubacteria group bacterium GW2011_GWA2_43_11]